MSRRSRGNEPPLPAPDFFDLAGSDPELLNSGRIPDPQPAHTPLFRWLARVLTAVEARLRARGDAAMRNALRFFWVLLMGAGVFLLVGPVLNAPMSFDEVIDSADIDEVDWIARDAQIDYAVGRTDDGRFTATVTETYDADFRNGPEPSVERVVVTEYHGHDVRFTLSSATIDGSAADIEITEKPTTTEVRLTRTDGQPLSGTQQVSLSYELHDLITSEVDDATGAVVDRFAWSLFAPTWPQGTKGVEVSLTLPAEINDALVRAPRGSIAWLLLSASSWLTPDHVTGDGATVYSFTNDDTMPPNAEATLSASFAAGTFTQPPTTALFWVQTYGPLLPLVVLAALALFALAARRIVWADSAGEPWYLPRAEPPEGLTPVHAAQLRGRVRHAELIEVLDAAPASGSRGREAWLAQLARAARRVGRWGNLPSALQRAARWRREDAAVGAGLRWVPDSYVRDFFTFAPIALTLVQWGVLRQLSHQVILTVVWWPALFVLVSTALAVVSVAAVHRPRPLTRAGALAVQQLKGIDVWARATRLLDRGPVGDPLLPYAVAFVGPRRAGRAVRELALREAGSRDADRGWRTAHFISGPAIAALIAALAVLAGSIVTVSIQPPPLGMDTEFITEYDDLPGTFSTDVTGLDISAELSRAGDGAARLHVIEHLDVRFDGTGSRVPQFAKEWPTQRYDQSLGFTLDAVRIDGEPVAYEQLPQPQTQSTAMVTQLADVLDGDHEVQIEYTLESAAVRVPAHGETTSDIDQVRWTAWFSFLDTEYYRDVDDLDAGRAQVRPLRVQLTVAPELATTLTSGGWISSPPYSERNNERRLDVLPLEDGLASKPWVTEERTSVDDAQRTRLDLRIGDVRDRADGALVATYDVDAVQSRTVADDSAGIAAGPWAVDAEVNDTLDKYALGLNDDLGAVLDFPAGTFTGTSPQAAETFLLGRALPYSALYALLGLVIVASAGVIVIVTRVQRRPSVSLRTTAFVTIPVIAVAQCVIFCWTVMPSPGSDSRGGWAIAAGVVMLTAVAAEIIMVARRAAATSGEARVSGKGRARNATRTRPSSRTRPRSRKGAE